MDQMFKNWLCYPVGDFDIKDYWTDRGIAYIDPATIILVVQFDLPVRYAGIWIGGNCLRISAKSASEIIGDIQSALSN
jgi:hypothetical protein